MHIGLVGALEVFDDDGNEVTTAARARVNSTARGTSRLRKTSGYVRFGSVRTI
jgi:hypothetical protein